MPDRTHHPARTRAIALSVGFVMLGLAAVGIAANAGRSDTDRPDSATSPTEPANLVAPRLAGHWVPDRHLTVRLQQRVPEGLDGFSVRFEADREALTALPRQLRKQMSRDPVYLTGRARFEDGAGRMDTLFTLTRIGGNLALKTITLPVPDPQQAAEGEDRRQPPVEVVYLQLARGHVREADLLFISDVEGRNSIALHRRGSMTTPPSAATPQPDAASASAPGDADAAEDPDIPEATTQRGGQAPEGPAAAADMPVAEMPEDLAASISRAIELIEAGEHEALFRHLAPAEVIEQLEAADRLEQAAEGFGRGAEGAALLIELRHALQQGPQNLAENAPDDAGEGRKVTFPAMDDDDAPLTFVREGDRWVLE